MKSGHRERQQELNAEVLVVWRGHLHHPVARIILHYQHITRQLNSYNDTRLLLSRFDSLITFIHPAQTCITFPRQVTMLTLRRPLLPYGYSYKASCARLD